jgi:hypothetical protein
MSEEQEAQAVSRTVKAGGTEYVIDKFRGYKAFRIGRLLTALGEIAPEVSKKVSAYVTEYRENNVDKISRATLEFRYPADAAAVSDEAWKESGGYIELANDPSQEETMAVIIPTAFDLAGDRIADLLAWVVADDKVLEEKDGEGEEAVTSYIEGLRKSLLFQAGVDELLDLALAAQEILREQMAGKGDQARSLLSLVGLGGETTEEEPEPEDEREVATAETTEGDEKAETHSTPESPTTSERPDSSTDSEPPTDGGEERSSTARAGAPSASTSG